ncbi:MAG: DUF6933 domain-containing protein [Thalassotalea sp.]
MLIFNCTKAATDFFTSSIKGKKHSPIEPTDHKTIEDAIQAQPSTLVQVGKNSVNNWHWLVHVITVKRKKSIIVMDYHSRFSMTLTGLKKGDEIAFLNMFDHHISLHVQQLMQMAIDDDDLVEESLNNYNATHDNCAFHQRGDRSVQATINDVSWYFDSEVHENGYTPQDFELIRFDAFVNQLLRKHKNQKEYFSPHHEFLRNWLENYSGLNDETITDKINQFKQDESVFFEQESEHAEDINIEAAEQKLANSVSNVSSTSNVVCLDAFRKNAKAPKE